MTPRDRNVCIDLRRHHVLTVHQLTELHFPTARKARERLLELTQRGVLLRFRPQRDSGSAPFHYVLGELGAHIVAGYFGLDVRRVITGLEEEDWQLAHSAKLPHLLDTHDFFIALIKACREAPGYQVTRWWSESRCEREWRTDGFEPLIRPDGQGVLVGPQGEASFLLEVDRGTERGTRLTERLQSYEQFAGQLELYSRIDKSWPNILLFVFPSARREQSARTKLRSLGKLHVATSHRGLHQAEPLGANWTLAHPATDRRVTLPELALISDRYREARA